MVRDLGVRPNGRFGVEPQVGLRPMLQLPGGAPQHDVAFYEHRLRCLASELLLTEERERRRLAVDLHDGPSQLIALAQMKLAVLLRTVHADMSGPLAEIRKVIEEADRSVRSLTFQLNAPALYEGELVAMLRWLADDIRTRYGLAIRFQDDGQAKPAGDSTRALLFRSVRELLINAAKHARSSQVRVSVSREPNALCVNVRDDGIGMDPRLARRKGCGLHLIRERMSLLGGSLRIESAPGRGMRIQLRVPHGTDDRLEA